ncbi:hypothetical protein LCGC14_2584440, partial [marine sediment metagenome]
SITLIKATSAVKDVFMGKNTAKF